MSTKTAPDLQRIGMFGGSFDPPHLAHVMLARAAVKQFQLDALHVVPTGLAWHKSRELSAPMHRLAMARLAFEDLAHVVVDERELQRKGPTFTIDTLKALQIENPQAQLYLFIGADQFSAFKQWHQWQEILEIAIICIADRAESTLAQTEFDAYAAQNHRFLILKLPLMSVSATQVRQLVASGSIASGEVAKLVPEPVARYISLHQLYAPR